MQYLTEFYAAKNKLVSLRGLEKLTNLTIIACQCNFIQNLDGLETLVQLEELYLQQNQVTSFAGLQNNTRLQTLDLAVNKLSRFDSLDHLSEVLRELWLNWNQLENSEHNRQYLSTFKVLETLYLADNQVSNVKDYQEMITGQIPHLKQLDGNMLRKGVKFYHQQTEGIHPTSFKTAAITTSLKTKNEEAMKLIEQAMSGGNK